MIFLAVMVLKVAIRKGNKPKGGTMNNKKALTAPCGLDCFNCEIYEDNLTDDFAGFIHDYLGVSKEDIPCKGCRKQDGKHYHLPSEGCSTLDCAKIKGVELCCDCDEFPCHVINEGV